MFVLQSDFAQPVFKLVDEAQFIKKTNQVLMVPIKNGN